MPGRVLTLNWETNNHYVSHETVEALREYLKENDLTDVYVAVNAYDPNVIDLLIELEEVHDYADISDWPDQLAALGKRHAFV